MEFTSCCQPIPFVEIVPCCMFMSKDCSVVQFVVGQLVFVNETSKRVFHKTQTNIKFWIKLTLIFLEFDFSKFSFSSQLQKSFDVFSRHNEITFLSKNIKCMSDGSLLWNFLFIRISDLIWTIHWIDWISSSIGYYFYFA